MKYDLEIRTEQFALDVLDFAQSIPSISFNKNSVEQLIRSSGSVGANYCEATEAESKKDFIHKISLSKKEVKESRYWLKLLARTNPDLRAEIEVLINEARELLFIFSKIIKSSKGGKFIEN